MTYKESLTKQMNSFASDPLARFVGYGLLNGKGGNGTMKEIPNEQIFETTVAENLMMGMAMGLALKGLRPMVILERFDFIGNCFDALVNHIDKSAIISRGQWTPGVIVRVVVGNSRKPLFTGATHTQDFTEAFRKILKMPVYRVTTPDEVAAGYEMAIADQKQNRSTMLVELKDNL
jgi:pyruvate/2-oxoglutarate/acetoin dehydrogenase E1 component